MLGQGGMGAVYQAYDRELERQVALKLIRSELAANPEILKRFKQELILARQITHKNVIRIFDLGQADGFKFITMDYIEGEDLQSVLRRKKKLDPAEASNIISQICRALEAAHAEGVIHRDLKPQNIMLDKAGRAYVMDFGIARSTLTPGMTQTGALIGTPEYMSPEQAKGQTLDVRSDIFSVGIIFFEMLAGQNPFSADTTMGKLWKRTSEPARSLADLDKTIPRPLCEIVRRCLEIDPEKRFASATELLLEIETWRGPQAGTRVLVPGRVGLPAYAKWAGAGAAVVLVAAGFFLRSKMIPHSPAPHAPVTLLIADFENTTGDAVFEGTLEPMLEVALEGASFISVYNRGQARKVAAQVQPGTSVVDNRLGRLVAMREGVSVVVSGSISSAGTEYRVFVQTTDAATGKKIQSKQLDAPRKDSVLTATGTLAGDIRRVLGDTTPESVQRAAAETFTAASLEAAHEYAIGQEMHVAGKWKDAIEHYTKAVDLDPNMGRAYAGIAVSYFNSGRRQEAEKYYQLALSKIDRMTDREKYRTRGVYYLVVSHNPDKAIEELTQLVNLYPADNLGMAGLALAHFYKRDMHSAVEVARRVVDLQPKNTPQRNNLGLYAMYAGDFDSGIREQQAVIEMNPNFVLAYVGLALSRMGKVELDHARETWHKLEKFGPDGASAAATGLADIDLYQGRAADAAAILEKAVAADEQNKNPDAAAVKWTTLAQAYLVLDRSGPARAALQRALADSKETSVLFWSSRIAESLGEDAKALDISKQLSGRLEPDAQAYAKLIQGELELKHRKPREAVTLFKESQKIADTWLGRLDLGQAYLEAGAFAEADSELEACLKRRGEATAAFLDEQPTYRLFPPVYYYIGRAQEGLKSPEATESYKSFLAMRNNADKDPMVADARHRIVAH
jgi:tetratricopeptide (TPR) repeat protein/predicted Ser/Thr protein kinase